MMATHRWSVAALYATCLLLCCHVTDGKLLTGSKEVAARRCATCEFVVETLDNMLRVRGT